MESRLVFLSLVGGVFLNFALVKAQAAASTAALTVPPQTTSIATLPVSSSSGLTNGTTGSGTPTTTVPTLSGPPDVLLNVPTLSVGRIELDVDNLQADI